MSKINYTLIRSRKRALSTSISVDFSGVKVRAPIWMPVWAINKFVEDKREWIERQLSKLPIEFSTQEKKNYRHGDSVMYLGNKLVLKVIINNTPSRTRIVIENDCLLIYISSHFSDQHMADEIKKSLILWYQEKGIELITQKANEYSHQIQASYSKITLKNVSSIWGSCSSKNSLSFNRHLIMAPVEIIDYVVIHEVCHMIHRDHSSRFWGLVRTLDRDYKSHRLWLRQNRHLLSF